MKELLKKGMSFVTFEFAFDNNCLSQQFAATHNSNRKDFSYWSTKATRQIVISRYWFELVISHFTFLFGLSSLLFLIIFPGSSFLLMDVFVSAFITFAVLLLFHYWPNFYFNFLPQLETIKETYEQKQFDQLEKCKKAQLSNPALVLIFYVLDKKSGMNSLQCNDQYALLLMKLYGVDPGSLKKNLELIFGNRKNFSERKCTEIRNRFREAQLFFEEMNFDEGLKTLNQLEQKILRT